MEPERIVDLVLQEMEAWILQLRAASRAAARPLDAAERGYLRGYFSDALLDAVRVLGVPRLDNPPFFARLPELGLPVPWDYASDVGLTAVDLILLVEHAIAPQRRPSILFRECVHVQQFSLLGAPQMIARYLHGLIVNGFDYRELPMERQARDLQLRFDAGLRPFSVEAAVREALAKGLI